MILGHTSMLAWTVYVSFLGVAVLLCLPSDKVRAARWAALLIAVGGLVSACGGARLGSGGAAFVTVTRQAWIAPLGIEFFLGADGISLSLVVLTGIAAVAGILFSWNIEHRAREFFALYLALIGGVYGVFLSYDLFLLFAFYEIAIIPKYFLIAIWGSTRKEYGAMKLALYSFVGSAMVWAGLIAAYVVAGGRTFNLFDLAGVNFPEPFQRWVFPLVFVGFAILAGLWPFHTWAPTGHVAAPTAGSMLLAGVVMKLGAYGALRVAMTLFPAGWAAWRLVFAILAVIGIVYGGMVALTQKDFKFVIGYSSVSHMGFVLLGLMAASDLGLSGAVLQMFSHGIIAGLLFAVVGRMVYDRTHTRMLSDLAKMGLNRTMPFAALTFVAGGLASMGMPGFSGFVAELSVLIGAWKVFPTLTVFAGLGILVGIAYTLRVVQKAFYSGRRESDAPSAMGLGGETGIFSEGVVLPGSPGRQQRVGNELGRPEPISLPERVGAVMLMGTTLVVGLYPRVLLDWIMPSLGSCLFDGLRKAASGN